MTTLTSPQAERDAELDAKLDEQFGPATPETQALIERSIEIHNVAAAMLSPDSLDLVMGSAVI